MSTLPRSLCTLTLFLASTWLTQAQASKGLEQKNFGKTEDGRQVSLFTLRNASGMTVTITNYGGTVTSIQVPDRNRKMGDVVLGFDSLDGYTAASNNAYFGALIGRYGNRLAHAKFSIDGKEYHVPANDGANALHGGTVGFNKRIWEPKDVSKPGTPALELHYLSSDGEMGFPGNLDVTVRYTLEKQALRIDYSAKTDKATVLNLTNHSYFNLAGAGSKTALDHRVMLAADRFLPVDETLIPTGTLQPVEGTPFDFRKATPIGARIDGSDQQLKLGKGYDHAYVLNTGGDLKKVAARVEEPASGRIMEVFTDQPSIQFYSGNMMSGKNKGIGGVYQPRSAFCMETQHYPDSPNEPKFPSTVLRPGQTFHSTTIYSFSTK